MALTLLIGGARAGKSRIASRLAGEAGDDVYVIATAEALDDEMSARIAIHRAERPPAWTVVEEPIELREALERVPERAAVIIDCLTLWVANLIGRNASDDHIAAETEACAAAAAARRGTSVVVTNEVGAGIVPAAAVARRYRDVLGRVNSVWAHEADRALLVVAGRTLELERVDG